MREFMGQPLVVWSVRAAMSCPLVDQIVASTDDRQVVAALAALPVRIVDRPEHLAIDKASTHDVLRHVDAVLGGAAGGPELLVLLQPTSPLREQGQIERGIKAMLDCPDADRLIEVTSQNLFTGKVADGWWKADFPEDTRSQELPSLWYPSGRLYVYRCATVFDEKRQCAEQCLAQPAPRERCTNIDHEEDFLWAELVYRRFATDYDYLGIESKLQTDCIDEHLDGSMAPERWKQKR